MPKIKDLGINIVPGTMRPPEVGGGGGCGLTRVQSDCNCISDWMAARAGGGMMADTVPTCSCECMPTFTPVCSQCDCISNVAAGMAARMPHSQCNCVSRCIAHSYGLLVTPDPKRFGLSRQDIADLKAQLQQAMANLEEAEKDLLPKTLEEIDAREKELQSELEALQARRNELKK